MSKSVEVAVALAQLLEDVPWRRHLQVKHAFHLQVEPGWRIVPRRIEDLHLVYVVRGGGAYVMEGRRVPFAPGRVYVLTPGLHHAGELDPEARPEIIPLRLTSHDNQTGELIDPRLPVCGCGWTSARPARLEGLFDSIYRARLNNTDRHVSLAAGLLHQLVVELLLELESPPVVQDVRISQVVRLLEQDHCRSWTLEGLAMLVHLSPKYLLRLFRKQIGVTPAVYHARLRCQRATSLLEETGLSVKETAAALGYADPFTFSRQYKRITGRSPSGYRCDHKDVSENSPS